MTQTEMNIVATQVYEHAERKLETIIAELKEYFSPGEIARLDETTEAWRNYQRKHAEFLASQYEGGSIQPLIYASALESLTIARIVELETELKLLKDTCFPYRERVTIGSTANGNSLCVSFFSGSCPAASALSLNLSKKSPRRFLGEIQKKVPLKTSFSFIKRTFSTGLLSKEANKMYQN